MSKRSYFVSGAGARRRIGFQRSLAKSREVRHPLHGIYSRIDVIWGLSTKSEKATLARIPFLANLILDRQAGGRGRAAISVFLIRRLRIVDVLDEVVDGDFLAHVSSLRVLRCCCHFRSSGTVAYVDAKRLTENELSDFSLLWHDGCD